MPPLSRASTRSVRSAPDFAPQSLLDVGAGPGTASWAAAETFPSLQSFALLDANDALRALALDLAKASARLGDLKYRKGEALAALADAEAADLVIASYMIGELDDAQRPKLAERLWSKTRGTLLVVEPGTPAGYARIIALRQQLIASGAHVAAPCPHDGHVRSSRRTGVTSPSAWRARARTSRSRAPSFPSRTRNFPMSR